MERPAGPIKAAPLAALVLGLLAGAVPMRSAAQPAPSFLATCGELRGAIATHGLSGDRLAVIEVIGRLATVRSDGALVYLALCEPPDPRVVCVTYSDNGRKPGDEVIVTGAYIPRGPDHIQLDPCLHHAPE